MSTTIYQGGGLKFILDGNFKNVFYLFYVTFKALKWHVNLEQLGNDELSIFKLVKDLKNLWSGT